MNRKDHARRPGRSSKWCPKPIRLAIYLRDGFACGYCGRDLSTAEPREVSLDHLRCQDHGGSNKPTNLITACFRCNRARGTKSWKQYATAGSVERISRLRRRALNTNLAKAILNGDVPLVEVLTKQGA